MKNSIIKFLIEASIIIAFIVGAIYVEKAFTNHPKGELTADISN